MKGDPTYQPRTLGKSWVTCNGIPGKVLQALAHAPMTADELETHLGTHHRPTVDALRRLRRSKLAHIGGWRPHATNPHAAHREVYAHGPGQDAAKPKPAPRPRRPTKPKPPPVRRATPHNTPTPHPDGIKTTFVEGINPWTGLPS